MLKVGNGPPPITTPQLVSPDSHSTIHSSSNGNMEVDVLPDAQPLAPAATLVEDGAMDDMDECEGHDRISVGVASEALNVHREVDSEELVKVKFETLRAMGQADDEDDEREDHDGAEVS